MASRVILSNTSSKGIPGNIKQYKLWMEKWLPSGRRLYQFGLSAICWEIWKSRNRACFDKKVIKHPAEVLLHACSLMNYWAGLYNEEFQGGLLEGVKALLARWRCKLETLLR
jgi:hypothetical protein